MSTWIHVSGPDDWEGLYVDGRMESQNHSLNWPYLLVNCLSLPTTFERRFVTDDYLSEEGNLPERLADIPAEAWEESE